MSYNKDLYKILLEFDFYIALNLSFDSKLNLLEE